MASSALERAAAHDGAVAAMERRSHPDLDRLVVDVAGPVERRQIDSRDGSLVVGDVAPVPAPHRTQRGDQAVPCGGRAAPPGPTAGGGVDPLLHEAHEAVEVVDAQRRGRVPDHAERVDAPDRLPEAQAGTAGRGRSHRDAAVGQRQARRAGHLPRPIRARCVRRRPRWTTPWPPATARTPPRTRGRRHGRSCASAPRRTIGPTSPAAAGRRTRTAMVRPVVESSTAVRALRRAQAGCLGDEERVADVDQVAQVAGQHQPLDGAAEHAERRLELDVIESAACRASTGSNRCSWRNDRNGPLRCSSTKRRGRSHSVIVLVIVHVMPKWRARHVTNSPNPITPAVTPPTARSPERSNELQMGVDRQREVERRLRVDGQQRLSIEANHRRPYPATDTVMRVTARRCGHRRRRRRVLSPPFSPGAVDRPSGCARSPTGWPASPGWWRSRWVGLAVRDSSRRLRLGLRVVLPGDHRPRGRAGIGLGGDGVRAG